MKIGYVRVSTVEQNLDRQISKMKDLGVDDRFLFTDKSTGKNFDRPGYLAMKQVIRENDLIYLDSLDRLGRNYDMIVKEWKEITRDVKADIIVLDNKELFDSRKFREMGDIGKLMEDQFLSMLAYVAEQELKKMHQRQKEGIAKAREKGVHFGRARVKIPSNFSSVVERWEAQEISCSEAQKILDMKPATFFRRVKEYRESA
ncbi:MAG: recombinase family protein [Anaerovoracaceae bacterium]